MARVRAALRYGPRQREYRELEMGDVRMDTVARKVFVNHVAVELTPTEFKLLHVLLCERGPRRHASAAPYRGVGSELSATRSNTCGSSCVNCAPR